MYKFFLFLIVLGTFSCESNEIDDSLIYDLKTGTFDSSQTNLATKNALNDNIDVAVFPHWEAADEIFGKDKRSTPEWAQVAAAGNRKPIPINQPIGDYLIDIISADGITLVYEAVLDETGTEIFYLRDTIMADELSTWILNDNLDDTL